MVDASKLAQVGYNYLGRPYDRKQPGGMDCQDFVEQCLADCGWHKNLGGSNSWYRYCIQNGWVGTPEECAQQFGKVPPGAFLFIWEPVSASTPDKFKHDGVGDITHIGLVTGTRQGAIHSSKSKGGVVESSFTGKTVKNGGWNRIGLATKDVDYHLGGSTPSGEPDIPDDPTPAPEPDPEPTYEQAVVVSKNGNPVNTRKGPDETYALSKAGKVALGTVVTILKTQVNRQGETWCRIRYTDPRGATWGCWMKKDFLQPIDEQSEDPDIPSDEGSQLYTVHIPFLTKYQAEAVIRQYVGSWMTDENGGSPGCVG